MGDTSESNTKDLSGELFLGVVALQTPPIQKNNYMCEMGPFPKYGEYSFKPHPLLQLSTG